MKWPWSKKPFTVQVVLPDEWQGKIEFLRANFPLNLEQLLTKAAQDRLGTLYERVKGKVESARSLNDAFASLDQQDQEIFGAGISVEGDKQSLHVIQHSCRHFSSATPPHFRPGEVPGSCTKQGGKPCLFSSQAAQKCNIFQPRKAF